MRQRAELAMSAELNQVHPRQRAVSVMVMTAVVEMRHHGSQPAYGAVDFGVNRIRCTRQAVFSMECIDNLDRQQAADKTRDSHWFLNSQAALCASALHAPLRVAQGRGTDEGRPSLHRCSASPSLGC